MKQYSHLTVLIGLTTSVLMPLVFGACKPGYSAETSARSDAMAPRVFFHVERY